MPRRLLIALPAVAIAFAYFGNATSCQAQDGDRPVVRLAEPISTGQDVTDVFPEKLLSEIRLESPHRDGGPKLIPYSGKAVEERPVSSKFVGIADGRFRHAKLYFEEHCLERHGSRSPLQEVRSAGNFYFNALLYPLRHFRDRKAPCQRSSASHCPGGCVGISR